MAKTFTNIFSRSWDVFCPDTSHNHSTTVALVVIAVKRRKFSYTVHISLHGVYCIVHSCMTDCVFWAVFFWQWLKPFPSRELLGLRSWVGGRIELLKYWIDEAEYEIIIRLALTVTICRQLLQTIDSCYSLSTTLTAVINCPHLWHAFVRSKEENIWRGKLFTGSYPLTGRDGPLVQLQLKSPSSKTNSALPWWTWTWTWTQRTQGPHDYHHMTTRRYKHRWCRWHAFIKYMVVMVRNVLSSIWHQN